MGERGLIVGKFYPPHRGHKHLIDAARARVDELWVIVCGKPEHAPSGDLRAEWLREIHPDVHVLSIDDRLDADDSKAWAESSIRWLGFVPDVVFTSEEYGDRFAHHLGCRHVLVDIERRTVPISATRVREDPLGCWEYLEPPVRAWYAMRVCLVGAESTGKTTLAAALAERFETVWVPEYGRLYTEEKVADAEYAWTSDEFTLIAGRQCALEEEAARRANRVLICDTDAFATAIWHRRYMGTPSPEVEAIAARHRRPDLYLLTDVDTPFVDDGTRDGEHIRDWMHAEFVAELTRQGRPFRLLAGTYEGRFAAAVRWVERVLEGQSLA